MSINEPHRVDQMLEGFVINQPANSQDKARPIPPAQAGDLPHVGMLKWLKRNTERNDMTLVSIEGQNIRAVDVIRAGNDNRVRPLQSMSQHWIKKSAQYFLPDDVAVISQNHPTTIPTIHTSHNT